MTNTPAVSASHQDLMGLTQTQFALSMAYGAAGWFGAILLCRALGPMGVFEGYTMVLLYGAILVATPPFIWLGRKLVGLAPHQVFLGMAIADMTALFLDGIAVAWFPSFYGATADLVANSAAAILFGAGSILAFGMIMNRWRTDEG